MKSETANMKAFECEQLKKLKSIVENTLKEEKLIIDYLLNPPQEISTKGQTVSDKVASFGGSWMFIISFFIILILWITFNVLAPNKVDFDPYPFILMTLVLSCMAALQAPIIMMSQNRKEEKDRQRSENNYLINLKAELEIKALNQKIDLLFEEQLIKLSESQPHQL